jgi:hypothetical protein
MDHEGKIFTAIVLLQFQWSAGIGLNYLAASSTHDTFKSRVVQG